MATLLNHPRQSFRVWVALMASALMHCAAVAIAELKRTPIPEAAERSCSFPEIEAQFLPEAEPARIEPEVTEIPLPTASPDESFFPEESATPPPSPRQHKSAPLVRPPTKNSGSASLASFKVFAINAPRPEYPYEARRARITGQGIAVITIDPNGNVSDVTMAKSTGSAVLDQATIAGFRRWRFNAGAPRLIRCPITYTMTGAAY